MWFSGNGPWWWSKLASDCGGGACEIGLLEMECSIPFQKPKGCEIGLKIPILSQMTEISLGFH